MASSKAQGARVDAYFAALRSLSIEWTLKK